MKSNPARLFRFIKPSSRLRLRKFRPLTLVLALLIGLSVLTVSAVATCNFLIKWGTSGIASGQFQTPRGIAVDNSGNVYVADTFTRVQKFNSSGTFISQFGVPGVVNGGFVTPFKVATDSAGNVYVSDSDSTAARVQKFNSSGVFQFVVGGFLNSATGIAVDSADNFYVGDQGNHRIRKFSSAGVLITSWGSSGTGDNQFDSPMGLAIDASDNVYVVDSANNR